MKRLYLFAVVMEIFGVCLCSAGVAIEAITSADIGYLIISVGSLCIAIGSVFFAKVAPWLREQNKGYK